MVRPMIPSPIIPTICAMVDPRGGQKSGRTASSPQGQVTQGAAGSQARTAQTLEKQGQNRGSSAPQTPERGRHRNSTRGRSPDTRLSRLAAPLQQTQGTISSTWVWNLDWR